MFMVVYSSPVMIIIVKFANNSYQVIFCMSIIELSNPSEKYFSIKVRQILQKV